MVSHRFPLRIHLNILFALFALSVLHAQKVTAPKASGDPETIDQIWQKASSKYDDQRTALLQKVDAIGRQGPFRAAWESLQKYQAPEWYRDAKFGIFIHWGVYSVPAFGSEWYPRLMYVEGTPEYKHHIATYGPQDKFGYKEFVPMFKAEHFDPTAWARLFKKAGAKYVVPVAEHHDGFAMYDSGLSDWTVAKMEPHRDTAGELAEAVRAEGLHFGVSSHRVEHNFFLGPGRTISSDVNDPRYAALYGPAHTWVMNPSGTPLNQVLPLIMISLTCHQHGRMTGSRAPQNLSRNITLTLFTSIGGLGRRRSDRTSHGSRRFITTALQNTAMSLV